MVKDSLTIQEHACAHVMLVEETEVPVELMGLITESHRRELKLSRQNTKDLRTIQEVISLEEDKELTLAEVLARVLSFYRRFVPYK